MKQQPSAGSHGKRVVGGGGLSTATRSETEKEKTKLRERQRRAITTKIFHGLRKHGGYQLSPRADINEVLRHLAMESGWTIEPDGTTYRRTTSKAASPATGCPMCGSTRGSATATPTSSVVVVGGGDCSTTASPRRFPPNPTSGGDHVVSVGGGSSGRFGAVSSQEELLLTDHQRSSNNNIPLELYMYGRLAVGGLHASTTTTAAAGANAGDRTSLGGGGGGATVVLGYHHIHHHHNMYLQGDQETRASNDNTPVASPLRRA